MTAACPDAKVIPLDFSAFKKLLSTASACARRRGDRQEAEQGDRPGLGRSVVIAQGWASALGWSSFLNLSAEQKREYC